MLSSNSFKNTDTISVGKYICSQFWGTLLECFHFLRLQYFTLLQFWGKYCIFNSTTFIWQLYISNNGKSNTTDKLLYQRERCILSCDPSYAISWASRREKNKNKNWDLHHATSCCSNAMQWEKDHKQRAKWVWISEESGQRGVSILHQELEVRF